MTVLKVLMGIYDNVRGKLCGNDGVWGQRIMTRWDGVQN